MSNLLTNTSGLTTLAALRQTDQNLNQVENQASAELAISAAAGKPAYSPIAAKTISNAGALGAAAGGLANMKTDVETASDSLPAAASMLGATTANLRTQWTYVSNPRHLLTTGVGSLVDANMNEAAAKLATLEVRQQLGVQALGISHSNAQLILKLLEL